MIYHYIFAQVGIKIAR